MKKTLICMMTLLLCVYLCACGTNENTSEESSQSVINSYTITWKNQDGTVLEIDNDVAYGTTPSYDGATPVKQDDTQYSYVWSGWSPEVTSVTGDTTYTATFSTGTHKVINCKDKLDYQDTLTPIGDDILDINQWYAQYPSGTDEGGMLISYLSADFANKYLSRDNDYVRFSLNAQDKGKSPNGSSVRSELHSTTSRYYFSGEDKKNEVVHTGNSAEFQYTFKVNSTQLDIAEFTVGQFEMYSGYDYTDEKTVQDKPLIMMEIIKGELTACIKYYNRSYETGHYEQLASSDKISLGYVENMKEVSIKIVLNDRKINIYRDGVEMVDTSFKDNQDTMYGVYFKLGIYYQTHQDDENINYLFTDVYVKDVSLKVN